MAAYLAEHVPHLQRLHLQLGLPPEALKADESTIEAAIKNAVTTLIRNREGEVDGWRDAIEDVRRSMVSVGRALGDKARDAVSAARRESESIESLPLQHGKLLKQRDVLEKEYEDRLAKIEEIRGQIDSLCVLLGTGFEPAKPLQPIAGPSRPAAVAPAGPSRRTSNLAMPPPTTSSDGTPWYTVTDDVLEEYQAELQRVIQERETRSQQLLESFRELLFLHAELGLPAIPISTPHHFPLHLLPSKANEERPGAHAGYEKTFSRYVSANAGANMDAADEGEDWSKGLEGVEPELGLLAWADEVSDLWVAERDTRMERIQTLYDQLEPLWMRLEVDQDQQDLFIEMNRGCGDAVIRAYEAELERCLELRRSSLSSFVVSARKEIELLWDELMMSEDERGEFGQFIDDDYTEELLQAHEDEAERLRAEIESKATMLPKVRDWHALKADEEELERNQNNPNRFSARGGAMLREEKLRKRVTILLPKVEADLLHVLPTWEEANARPFMVQGERVVDKILEAREAKEAAKEAKKRAKMGLAPAKTVAAVRATPAPSQRMRNVSTMSTMSRKREAPTPTPFGYGTVKKAKASAPPSTIKPRNMTQPPRYVAATPTPYSALPRAVSHTATRTVSSSTTSSRSSVQGIPTLTYNIKPATGIGKANGRVPRRESFKPRQSLAGNLIHAAKARRSSTGWEVSEVVEEDEDVF